MEHAEKHSEKSQTKEKSIELLDEQMKKYAEVLENLDTSAFQLRINEKGSIENIPTSLRPASENNIWKNIERLIQARSHQAEQQLILMKQTPGVLDAHLLNGAVIVTIDSSQQIPDCIDTKSSEPGTFHRGGIRTQDAHGSITFIWIDINPEKRKHDEVSSTTSLIHEVHHHNYALVNMALALDADRRFRTGCSDFFQAQLVHHIRTGEREREPRNQIDVLDEEEMDFLNDHDLFSTLLMKEIPFDPKESSFFHAQRDRQYQAAYLNELHSSFLQKKQQWFFWNEKVYSSRKAGFHHELVGDDFRDIDAVKNLFCYLQALYACDVIWKNIDEHSEDQKSRLGPFSKSLYLEFPNIYSKAGALIGASRTVRQAEKFVKGLWESLKSNRLVQRELKERQLPWFRQYEGEGTPASGETIETFLFGETTTAA